MKKKINSKELRYKKFFIKRNWTFSQISLNILVLIFLFMVLFPMWLMLIKSVKNPDQDYLNPFTITYPFLWDNYKVAWTVVSPMIFNTIIIVIPVTLGVLIVNSFAAFAFVRLRFPFKETIFLAILSLMMIPGVLSLIAQYDLADQLNLIDSRWGVILPSIAVNIPFALFLLRTFFRAVPTDLFDAASIDGAPLFVQFITIMIPLCSPILVMLTINCIIGTWNDLVWPRLILLKEELHTITIGLMPFTNSYYAKYRSYGPPMAGYVITSLPLMIMFAFASKQFISGMTSGAFKM